SQEHAGLEGQCRSAAGLLRIALLFLAARQSRRLAGAARALTPGRCGHPSRGRQPAETAALFATTRTLFPKVVQHVWGQSALRHTRILVPVLARPILLTG